MRVETQQRILQADPGQTVELTVEVVNTTELIDGVVASLEGLPEAVVTAEPALLPLFPDAQGHIRLQVQVPTTAAAGTHPLTVSIVSTAGSPTQFVEVDLSVSAGPSVELHRNPQVIRARRKATFAVEVVNTGNTALDVTLDDEREDRRTTAVFTPQVFIVEPGQTMPVEMLVRGPRMVTGAEIDRSVTIDLRARRAHSIPAMTETEAEPELQAQSDVILRQRPLIGRGLLTVLILASIVALWALAFLLGLTQVFAGDPLTKTSPVSFPTSTVAADGKGATTGNANPASIAGAAPAGALPKTGLVPPGVGGSVSGVVTARSNRAPVGRILVQAYRQGRKGPVLVSSAASQSDGTYTVAGLFPTHYTLKFSARGYTPVWYPAAPSRAGADRVPVAAQTATKSINATIRGLPATISGTIEPGDSLEPPVTTVVARMVDAAGTVASTAPAATTTSDAGGRYTLTGLPAPGTYELSFSADGYRVTKVLTSVAGGETRLQPSVVPGAGIGSIAGVVTDGTNPLGNVTVSTTVGNTEVVVTTPTVGAVGAFDLGNLPTPGTYVVQFSSPSHGSVTRIVDLEAGTSERSLVVDLAAGTGSVSGKLVALDGTGLGGATVTVGGTSTDPNAEPPTTTTLTSGDVGAFSISGLPAPGEYTLTFTLAGYGSETVPVSLSASGPAPTLRVELGTRLGRIRGSVVDANGNPYVGATVTVTDGKTARTTTTTAPGGALGSGGYQVGSLAPGTYSVTVSADGMLQQTAMVTVYSGITSVQDLRLRRP